KHSVPTSFLIHHSTHPRALHSFPTRRSSDLEQKAPPRPPRLPEPAATATPRPLAPQFSADASTPPKASSLQTLRAEREPHPLTRSEEHTSELQSLRHLVCRLLLEKKKKQTTE